MKLSKNAKNAVLLGTLCSIAYLAVYFARNILSAVSEQMKQKADFTDDAIGLLLAAFSVFYAFGQLINGWLGDKLKARYMISIGLFMVKIFYLNRTCRSYDLESGALRLLYSAPSVFDIFFII